MQAKKAKNQESVMDTGGPPSAQTSTQTNVQVQVKNDSGFLSGLKFGGRLLAIALVFIALVAVGDAAAQDDCKVTIYQADIRWAFAVDGVWGKLVDFLAEEGICVAIGNEEYTFTSNVYGLNPILGPVDFEPGLYQEVIHTRGDILIVAPTVIDSECGYDSFDWGVGTIIADNEIHQTLVNIKRPCKVILDVQNANGDWQIEYLPFQK